MAEPNCVPVAEAARRLKVTPGRVRQLLDVGELAPVHFAAGGRLVSEASLRRLEREKAEQQGQGGQQHGVGKSRS